MTIEFRSKTLRDPSLYAALTGYSFKYPVIVVETHGAHVVTAVNPKSRDSRTLTVLCGGAIIDHRRYGRKITINRVYGDELLCMAQHLDANGKPETALVLEEYCNPDSIKRAIRVDAREVFLRLACHSLSL
jgi:hypothetical protein